MKSTADRHDWDALNYETTFIACVECGRLAERIAALVDSEEFALKSGNRAG